MASIPPNQTLYVQNLYEKLPKQGESNDVGAAHHFGTCSITAAGADSSCSMSCLVAASASLDDAVHSVDNLPLSLCFLAVVPCTCIIKSGSLG